MDLDKSCFSALWSWMNLSVFWLLLCLSFHSRTERNFFLSRNLYLLYYSVLFQILKFLEKVRSLQINESLTTVYKKMDLYS
jgi:hypothetical protein